MNLKDKVAIVTGAAGGIGKHLCRGLSLEGLRLVLASRNRTALEGLAGELRARGATAIAVPTDIVSEESTESCVASALAAFGQIDVLINNAAVFARGKVVQLAPSEWRKVIDTNLTGTFLMTRAVLPHMIKRQSGSIIMISSTSGKKGDPGASAYAASKFGLMGLAQSLLYEVRKDNIRVCTVFPSYVDVGEPKGEEGAGIHMHAQDVADAIISVLKLPGRALLREVEIWATNP